MLNRRVGSSEIIRPSCDPNQRADLIAWLLTRPAAGPIRQCLGAGLPNSESDDDRGADGLSLSWSSRSATPANTMYDASRSFTTNDASSSYERCDQSGTKSVIHGAVKQVARVTQR